MLRSSSGSWRELGVPAELHVAGGSLACNSEYRFSHWASIIHDMERETPIASAFDRANSRLALCLTHQLQRMGQESLRKTAKPPTSSENWELALSVVLLGRMLWESCRCNRCGSQSSRDDVERAISIGCQLRADKETPCCV